MNNSIFWIFRLNFAISKLNFDEFLSEFEPLRISAKFSENLKISRESGKIPENAEFFFGNLKQDVENCEIIIHYFLFISHSSP